ncbi:MAG: hypothetical protein VKL42_06780 [Snowella sp.]|nr:hypothetical protein [Snowella sp.]
MKNPQNILKNAAGVWFPNPNRKISLKNAVEVCFPNPNRKISLKMR